MTMEVETNNTTMEIETNDNMPWAHLKATKDILSRQSEPDLPPPPVQILDWLFLSNLHYVRKGSLLKSLGITHVLSTNRMPLNQVQALRKDFDRYGIRHCHVNGEDDAEYDMIGNHWDECYNFLRKAKKDGGKVVIHCSAGVNRSGLIAASAWLMIEDTTLLQVVEGMKAKRGIVLINESFQRQLCVLAANNGKLGPKPEGYSDEPINQTTETLPTMDDAELLEEFLQSDDI